MHNLLHWVCSNNKGQVLITDTHKQRMENSFAKLQIEHQIVELYML